MADRGVLAVMQLDMFGEARATPPAANSPQIERIRSDPSDPSPDRTAPPLLSEALAYHDYGPTAAEYCAFARNPHFGDWIEGRLVVRVERQLGHRPMTWLASVDLELPDERRTGWGEWTVRATQDEAAEEASAMLLAGRAMLEASMRGEAVETPGDRRLRAAEEHADAAPEVQAAAKAVAEALALRRQLGAFNDGHPEAHVRYLVAKQEHESARQRAMDAFWRAHRWREFV